LVGAYVAATVVTLVQYLRFRDRRLLVLVFLFAFQAQALAREWYDYRKDVFQSGACALGLLLVLMLSPRHPRPVPPPAPPARPEGGGGEVLPPREGSGGP
jgi:hypothetical protein